MLCESCPRRAACREICPALEAKLPKLHDNITEGHIADINYLRNLAYYRKEASATLDWRVRLCGRERKILDMVLNQSLSLKRAAFMLGVSRTWVNRLFGHAIARKSRKAVVNTERSSRELQKPG